MFCLPDNSFPIQVGAHVGQCLATSIVTDWFKKEIGCDSVMANGCNLTHDILRTLSLKFTITTRLTANITGRKDDLDLRPVCIQELGDAIDI